jgi:hypothetical protein
MLNTPSTLGAPTPGKRASVRPWVAGALILTGLVGALITYKVGGSLATVEHAGRTGALKARTPAVAEATLPGVARPLARSANYLGIVWPALVFGVLIGAAVRALIPSSWLAATLARSLPGSQLLAGLAGAPLMLCSCCVAPVFAAVHDRTRRAAPATALLLAAPSLNPAALVLTFMLFTPAIATTRLAMALVLVFGVSALAARLAGRTEGAPAACPLETATDDSLGGLLKTFAAEVWTLARTTLPLIVLGVLASSVLVEVLPIDRLEGAGGLLAVLAVALVSVPLALPTFAEIPLAQGLLAAGAPAGAAVALLIAGPAINLPSLLTLRRSTSLRYAAALGLGTFLVAVLGGLLV